MLIFVVRAVFDFVFVVVEQKNFAEADRAYRRARTLSPLLGELLKIA